MFVTGSASSWPFWRRHSSRRAGMSQRMRCSDIRHDCFCGARCMVGVRLTNNDRCFFNPTISMVSVHPGGLHYCPTLNTRAVALSGLPLLLALEARSRRGRPQIETDLRALIRRMSIENRFGSVAHPASRSQRFANKSPEPNANKRHQSSSDLSGFTGFSQRTTLAHNGPVGGWCPISAATEIRFAFRS